MDKRQAALFFGLAVLSSSLGWLSLTFGMEGTQLNQAEVQSLGCLLIIFGGGYLLLSLALAMRGFKRLHWLSDIRLAGILSIAAFFSSVPLAITFGLANKPTILTAITFALTWPPLSFYLSHKDQ